MSTIYCEKKGSRGQLLFWEARINKNKVTYEWGQIDGKVQTKENVFTKGKNIGRSNETTPVEQALLEAEIKARHKIEGGYKIKNGYKLAKRKTVLKQAAQVPKPMLAHDITKHFNKLTDLIYVQPKLDGLRCLANAKTGKLYSRNGKPILGVPHLEKEIKSLGIKFCEWLDGELYNHSMTFQEITSIVRRTKNLADQEDIKQIQFHIFDFVMDVPFRKRVAKLNKLHEKTRNNKFIQSVWTEHWCYESLLKAHEMYTESGYEGTMVRLDNDKPYENKRSHTLFKLKSFLQEEYEVIGFEKEKFTDSLGACILVDKNGNEFNARPAVPQETKDEIWNNQDDYVGMIATVKFQEFSDDGIPRFPVLEGFRHPDDM